MSSRSVPLSDPRAWHTLELGRACYFITLYVDTIALLRHPVPTDAWHDVICCNYSNIRQTVQDVTVV